MPYLALVLLFLAALCGGVIAGLIGVGGGIIYVIIYENYFYHFYDTAQFAHSDTVVKAIIANSVFSTMFAGFMGAWENYRIGNFYPRIIVTIGLPALISALGITSLLSLTHFYSLEKFTILFIIVLLPFIFRMLFSQSPEFHTTISSPPSWGLITTGLVSGAVTALTGLGGGVVVIPALNGLFKLPIHKTIACSLGVIGIVSLGLTLYNIFGESYEVAQFSYATGFILYPMVIPVIGGIMVATNWGVKLAQHLSSFWLKLIFAFATLFILGNLCYNAFL